MKIIQIAGRSNTGKTTFAAALLRREKKWTLLPAAIALALAALIAILYFTGVLAPMLSPFLYPVY